jgi:nuclear pore complex protein Nup210
MFRFIPWADSPYNTEPILEQLEKQGQQGNKVLLEGVKTGSAKVSVRYGSSFQIVQKFIR